VLHWMFQPDHRFVLEGGCPCHEVLSEGACILSKKRLPVTLDRDPCSDGLVQPLMCAGSEPLD